MNKGGASRICSFFLTGITFRSVKNGSVAQLVRASPRQGEGPQFESERSHQTTPPREWQGRSGE